MADARDIGSGCFATVTYPSVYPTDPEIYHRDLDTFLKRLDRAYPGSCGWWRLEFQKRGAPHFHLLIFGTQENVKNLRAWIKVAWYEVVGSNDPKHLAAGTQCDLIANRRHAMRYASKYAAKIDDKTKSGPIGRTWGEFGRVDRSPFLEVKMTHLQAARLRYLVLAVLKGWKSKYASSFEGMSATQGFSIFGLGAQSDETWSDPEDSMIIRAVREILLE